MAIPSEPMMIPHPRTSDARPDCARHIFYTGIHGLLRHVVYSVSKTITLAHNINA